VLVVVLLAAPLSAIFMRQDTEKVPVSRLVTNLERLAKEDPRNAQMQINLARLHAMAYALKTDTLDAAARRMDDKTEIPYYLPGPTVPETVRPAASPEHAARAADHLKSAIQHYESALALAPDNMMARLGRGWARQQAGENAGAIDDYRRVILAAWPQESKTKMLMPAQRFLSQEAIGYLIPLLDPKRDAIEIRDLMTKQDDLKNRPRAITPIAIPLEDDIAPAAIGDARARVRFDADGSALGREWTWITPRAGWLVYDSDGRGEITSALQLFGNVTFWLFWDNGYHAMRGLDDDNDGTLAGAELRHLAIWHDRNSNGRSDVGEVQPLSAHGIVALSCGHADGDGNRIAAFSPRGVTFADGRTRPSYDVILHQPAPTLTRR
jgi:tetratricopeptide (TPR) repeat protein